MAVAAAADRADQHLVTAVVAELPAQAGDAVVDAAVEGAVVAAGSEIEKLIAREAPVRGGGRTPAQVQLAGAETKDAAVRVRHVGAAIDPPRAEAQHGGVRATAAQDHVDARDQLLGLARLHQIVVGAGLQPGDAIGGVAVAGQQDDPGLGRQGAQVAREREAVLVGQGHVEHDQVRGFAGPAGPAVPRRLGLAHAVPGARQHKGDELAHLRIVIDRDQFRQRASFPPATWQIVARPGWHYDDGMANADTTATQSVGGANGGGRTKGCRWGPWSRSFAP